MRPHIAVVALVGIGLVLAPALPAAAGCDPVEATARAVRIEAHLAAEARAARRWNVGWAITFAGLSAVQLGAVGVEWTPFGEFDDDTREGLYVGAAKAALASAARLAMPLRVERPARTGDPCADLAAAERALRATARRERRAFFVNHTGSVAFSLAGLLLLGLHYDTWEEGAISVALGYPVGLLSTYTMPRGSWRAVRRGDLLAGGDGASWQLGVVRHRAFTGLVLGGTF